MADVDTEATSADKSPKVKKTTSKPKNPPAHPPYAVMIVDSIKAMKLRTGSSRQAILKYICANYQVEPAVAQARVRTALKKLVEEKKLIPGGQPGKKGSGSYKLVAVEKPAVVKQTPTKKPVAKKVKTPVKAAVKVKKPVVKKTVAKKTPLKKPAAKKAKTPVKADAIASKPAAKKTEKGNSSDTKAKDQKKTTKPKDEAAKKSAEPKTGKPAASAKAKADKAK